MRRDVRIWILTLFLSLFLPGFILLGVTKLVAFDHDFYAAQFSLYEPAVEDPVGITQDLLSFLYESPNDEAKVVAFEQNEIAHLLDVKRLMHRALALFFFLGIALLILIILLFVADQKHFLKHMGTGLSIGGILTLLLGFLMAGIFNNFDAAFLGFHEIFFIGNYLFPADALLIILFPTSFWVALVSRILTGVIIIANILIGVGIFLLLYRKIRGVSHAHH